jgi:hypothetical protein
MAHIELKKARDYHTKKLKQINDISSLKRIESEYEEILDFEKKHNLQYSCVMENNIIAIKQLYSFTNICDININLETNSYDLLMYGKAFSHIMKPEVARIVDLLYKKKITDVRGIFGVHCHGTDFTFKLYNVDILDILNII